MQNNISFKVLNVIFAGFLFNGCSTAYIRAEKEGHYRHALEIMPTDAPPEHRARIEKAGITERENLMKKEITRCTAESISMCSKDFFHHRDWYLKTQKTIYEQRKAAHVSGGEEYPEYPKADDVYFSAFMTRVAKIKEEVSGGNISGVALNAITDCYNVLSYYKKNDPLLEKISTECKIVFTPVVFILRRSFTDQKLQPMSRIFAMRALMHLGEKSFSEEQFRNSLLLAAEHYRPNIKFTLTLNPKCEYLRPFISNALLEKHIKSSNQELNAFVDIQDCDKSYSKQETVQNISKKSRVLKWVEEQEIVGYEPTKGSCSSFDTVYYGTEKKTTYTNTYCTPGVRAVYKSKMVQKEVEVVKTRTYTEEMYYVYDKIKGTARIGDKEVNLSEDLKFNTSARKGEKSVEENVKEIRKLAYRYWAQDRIVRDLMPLAAKQFWKEQIQRLRSNRDTYSLQEADALVVITNQAGMDRFESRRRTGLCPDHSKVKKGPYENIDGLLYDVHKIDLSICQ